MHPHHVLAGVGAIHDFGPFYITGVEFRRGGLGKSIPDEVPVFEVGGTVALDRVELGAITVFAEPVVSAAEFDQAATVGVDDISGGVFKLDPVGITKRSAACAKIR